MAALLLALNTSASMDLLLAISWSPLMASLDNLVLSLPDTSQTAEVWWLATRQGITSPQFCQ